jgi:hypothetical protein
MRALDVQKHLRKNRPVGGLPPPPPARGRIATPRLNDLTSWGRENLGSKSLQPRCKAAAATIRKPMRNVRQGVETDLRIWRTQHGCMTFRG